MKGCDTISCALVGQFMGRSESDGGPKTPSE